MITNVHSSSCNGPAIFVRFQLNLNFFDRFSNNTQISNFMKIRPVEAELFHADGRAERRSDGRTDGRTDRQRETDTTKLIVAFRNFANTPKNADFNKTSPCTIKEHCEQLSRQRE